jgi:hypothetical protein
MKMRKLIFVLLMFFLSIAAFGQTSTGSLSGSVNDQSKGAVPGVSISLTNLQTGITTGTQSSKAGVYSIQSIQPGTYRLTAKKDGYAEAEVDNVEIQTGVSATINIQLNVGKAADTVVEVIASQELLSPESATITGVVAKQVVEDLPYPERSALEVATLMPGVQGDPSYTGGIQSENPGTFTQPVTTGASMSVSGSRPGSTAHLVDGFDITLSGYPRVGVTFSPDVIREVTVQQNGLAAQYGRTGGGIINQSTMSGGTKYHGALMFRHSGPPLVASTQGTVGYEMHQNLFGAGVGGPVPVPFEKKSHTFFYGSYEPLRGSSRQLSAGRVPTPQELAGDFHNSLDLLNTTILKSQGYAAAYAVPRLGSIDYQFPLNTQGFPISTRYSSSSSYVQAVNPNPNTAFCTGLPTGACGLDDIGPQVAANPVAQYVNSLLPMPASKTSYTQFLYPDGNTYNNLGDNANEERAVVNNDNRYTLRVDQELRDFDHIILRYTRVPVYGSRSGFLGPDSVANNIATDTTTAQNATLSETHIFGGASVNEFRVSYLRAARHRGPSPRSLAKDFGAAMGLSAAEAGVGFPALQFGNGLPTIGGGGSQTDGGRSLDINFGIGDDFSRLIGRHSLKFGGEWRALQLNRTDNQDTYGGNYTFASGYTNNGSSGGSSLASFDLGILSQFLIRTPQPFYYRWKYGAAYLQDDWRIFPKLTLNLGFRYNLETPRKEKYNLQGSFMAGNQGTLNGYPVTGAFVFSGHNGLEKTLWPMNYKGFEPRVGVAYAPVSRMTVRAAYSLIHTPLTGLGNDVAPDLAPATSSIGGVLGGVNPSAWVNYITNPISVPTNLSIMRSGPLYTYVSSAGSSGSSTVGLLPNINQSNAVPYVQLWSLSIQVKLAHQTMAEVSYVGQRGTHLFAPPTDTNAPPLNLLMAQIQAHTNMGATNVSNPYGLGLETLLESERPYQQFYNNVIESTYNRTASSNYNGLYAHTLTTFSGGLRLLTSFSWSKSLDDASSGMIDNNATDVYGFAYPQTPYSLKGEYSLSTFDIPLQVHAAYSYMLPFGTGKEFFNSCPHWLNTIIGGWSTSGIFGALSGYPLRVTVGGPGYFISTAAPTTSNPNPKPGGNGTAEQDFNLRPNIVPGVPIIKKNWKSDPFGYNGVGYLNAAAFAVPGTLGNPVLGNARRTLGQARDPRTITFDASVRKLFAITPQRVRLILSADAINALNHPNYFLGTGTAEHEVFGSLDTTTGDPGYGTYAVNSNFGNITTASSGRNLALGARLTF